MSVKEELSEEKSEEQTAHFCNNNENKEEEEEEDVHDDNTTEGNDNKDKKIQAAKASKRPKKKVISKKMKNEQQQQQKNNNNHDNDNDTAVHTCPNCNKSFKTKPGMKYHIDRKVCQKVKVSFSQKKEKDQQPSDTSDMMKKEKESIENDSGNNRRSKRQKTTKSIKYEDDDDDDDDNDNFVENVDIDSSMDIREDGDEENDEDQDDSHGKKGRHHKRQKREERNKTIKRNCPHCEKSFKAKDGLKYHIDNYVCRIDECTDPKIIAKSKSTPNKKRKPYKSSTGSKTNTIRGALHDRTCPDCQAVFTSVNGRDYHVKNNVCQKGTICKISRGLDIRSRRTAAAPAIKKTAKRMPPFHTLTPGDRFVIPFGIVEVVKDDRAIPTVKMLPIDIRQQFKTYGVFKHNEVKRLTSAHVKRSSKLRIRRNDIDALYEKKGKANRRSIFEAYFEGDPVYMKSVTTPSESINQSSGFADVVNPKEPPNSFPDRIVECIRVTDQRSHVLDCGTFNNTVKRDAKQEGKLFLQRRLLTKRYDEFDRVYNCDDCGHKFVTPQMLKAHVDRKPSKCIQNARIVTTRREQINSRIESEMTDLIRFGIKRKYPTKRKSTDITGNDQPREKYKKKKAESIIYPEVILALGFKLVAKSIPRNNNSSVVNYTERAKKVPTNSIYLADAEVDVVLHNLQEEFQLQQRKADDQMYGSMYAEVYKALKFKFPGKKKGTNVGNKIGKKIRRKRAVKPKPPPPPIPIPPAIDSRALIDEVDSGRWPSINRNVEVSHDVLCVICKKDGDLLCCNFCHLAEHLKCIRQRFTIKNPEADEDFMCHKCIQTILARRNRAEKRRLEKQVNTENKIQRELLSETRKNPGEGNEYHYMAAQAQDVNELVELLKDSQLRLRQSIETSKMNNIRRRIISGVYP